MAKSVCKRRSWIRLESRGKRIVLRDPCCPTPIFVELLYRIERVDRWIAALATGGKRITGFQQTPDFSARRFVLEGTGASRRCSVHIGFIEWQQGQRSQLGCRLDLDLDGHRQRSRILGALFSPTAETSVREVGHLVQYLENDGRPCWPPPCAGSGSGSPFSERTRRW